MHDVACEFTRVAMRIKDAQKQLARTSLMQFIALFGELKRDKGLPLVVNATTGRKQQEP